MGCTSLNRFFELSEIYRRKPWGREQETLLVPVPRKLRTEGLRLLSIVRDVILYRSGFLGPLERRPSKCETCWRTEDISENPWRRGTASAFRLTGVPSNASASRLTGSSNPREKPEPTSAVAEETGTWGGEACMDDAPWVVSGRAPVDPKPRVPTESTDGRWCPMRRRAACNRSSAAPPWGGSDCQSSHPL